MTNVHQPILDAYLTPLAGLDDVGELVIVRDLGNVEVEANVRVAAPPVWWPHTTLTKLASRAWLLRREGERSRPDLMMTVHWFPDGPVVLRVARRLGVPLVANIIGSSAELTSGGRRVALSRLPHAFKRWAENYQRDRMNEAAVITCTGRATCDWFRAAGVVRPSFAVLHAAIGESWYRDGPGPRDIDVAYVGRVDPDKRIDRLLAVLAAIGQRRPGTRAAVIGVSETELSGFVGLPVAQTTLRDGLAFLGRVPRVSEVLHRAKVLLLTSDTEGRTLAVLEAMACGAVPVVTDVGDLREALDDGRAGVTVPLDATEGRVVAALSSAVVALLNDEPRRQALAATAREFVRREHDPNRTREEWRMVIREAFVARRRQCGSS